MKLYKTLNLREVKATAKVAPTIFLISVISILFCLLCGMSPRKDSHKVDKLGINIMEVMFPLAKEYKVSPKDTTLWVVYDTLEEIINIIRFKSIIRDTVWSILDTNGATLGIAFKVFPKGYGGPIEILAGLSIDTAVAGIRVATPEEGLKETPGLGTKITEKWFRHQLIGKKEKALYLKKDGGTLDAITAATISSRAVVNGVRKGVEEYKKYLDPSKCYQHK